MRAYGGQRSSLRPRLPDSHAVRSARPVVGRARPWPRAAIDERRGPHHDRHRGPSASASARAPPSNAAYSIMRSVVSRRQARAQRIVFPEAGTPRNPARGPEPCVRRGPGLPGLARTARPRSRPTARKHDFDLFLQRARRSWTPVGRQELRRVTRPRLCGSYASARGVTRGPARSLVVRKNNYYGMMMVRSAARPTAWLAGLTFNVPRDHPSGVADPGPPSRGQGRDTSKDMMLIKESDVKLLC